MTNPIQTFTGVYCVEHKNDLGKTEDWSFAISPEVNLEIQRVLWRDGDRGRIIEYAKGNDLEIEYSSLEKAAKGVDTTLTARKITVLNSLDQHSYILTPLTLNTYNDKIKDRISGHPKFATEKEMNQFFFHLEG
jgi:hypothetical protein